MPQSRSSAISCLERLRLSSLVTRAIQANYAAKEAHARAVKDKEDFGPYAVTLFKARRAESAAAVALDRDRKEHGC